MSWGENMELHLAKKCSGEVAGEYLISFKTEGELWTEKEVLHCIENLEKFIKDAKKIIQKHGAHELVIRTNI